MFVPPNESVILDWVLVANGVASQFTVDNTAIVRVDPRGEHFHYGADFIQNSTVDTDGYIRKTVTMDRNGLWRFTLCTKRSQNDIVELSQMLLQCVQPANVVRQNVYNATGTTTIVPLP